MLLVIGVIAATSLFFFRKNKIENNTTESISAMLKTESKTKFNEDLKEVSNIANSKGTDSRINLIVNTSGKLDEIVSVLASYKIETDTKITNKAISNKLKEVNQERNLLQSMMDEYLIKKDSGLFDRTVGANDIYLQSCDYLMAYAEFADLLSNNLKVDRESDIKFNMFEIYTIIVKQTFSKTNAEDRTESAVVVENASNINLMNSVLKIRDSFVVKIANEGKENEQVTLLFTENCYLFNISFKQCNKSLFAKNLSANVDLDEDKLQSTVEKKTTNYFKLIFGI